MLRRIPQGCGSRELSVIPPPVWTSCRPARRAGKTAVLLLVACVAFGIAGFLVYKAYRDDPTLFSGNLQKPFEEGLVGPDQVKPITGGTPEEIEAQLREQAQRQVPPGGPRTSTAKQAQSTAPGPLEVRTPIQIRKGPGGTAMVVLGKARGSSVPSYNRSVQLGLLARELVRQSFLVAARDGLGILTRDESLGDPEGIDAESSATATFTSLAPTGARGKLLVQQGPPPVEGAKVGSPILERDLAALQSDGDGYQGLVIDLERLASDDLPKLLKGLGAVAVTRQAKPEGKPVADVEESLSRMDEFSQLAAIRTLHETARRDGESPQVLGALARSYAVLGVLSEHQYSPAHKVYMARALLYAQRLVRTTEGSAMGLRHRAFAEALSGLHREAKRDLADAAAMPSDKPAPSWVSLLDAYLRFDLPALRPVAPGDSDTGLAALLRMHASGFPARHPRLADAARDLIKVAPGCSLAYHEMCESQLIEMVRVGSGAAIVALDRAGLPRVRAIPGLPDSLAEKVKAAGSIDDAAKALGDPKLNAEDVGEPSAAVVARCIADTRLSQVADRMRFVAVQLSAPFEDEFAKLKPMIAGHRYEGAFLPLDNRPDSAEQFAKFVEGFDHDVFDLSYLPLLSVASLEMPPIKGPKMQLGEAHLDPIYRDIGVMLDGIGTVGWGLEPKTMYRINPASPFAIVKLIFINDPEVSARMKEWLTDPKVDPLVLSAAAAKARELSRFDEAIPAFERLAKEAPSVRSYAELAATYTQAKRTADAQKTLEAALKLPDEGLAHADIATRLARSLMEQNQYKKARPFAERAARSYAAWAMLCLIDCYEGLGLWDEAEEWILRHRERYGNDPFAHLRFCLRTGHGDRQRAIEEAKAILPRIPEGLETLTIRAEVAALTGSPKQAVALYKEGLKNLPNPHIEELAGIVLADEVGEKAERDRLIETVRSGDLKSRGARILGLIADSLRAQDPIQPDLKVIDGILKEMSPSGRVAMSFIVGRLLIQHGRVAEARTYLEAATGSSDLAPYLRCLAAESLRAHGINYEAKAIETP